MTNRRRRDEFMHLARRAKGLAIPISLFPKVARDTRFALEQCDRRNWWSFGLSGVVAVGATQQMIRGVQRRAAAAVGSQ